MHTFANGVTAYSVHTNSAVPDSKFTDIRKTANLLMTMPERTFLDEDVQTGKLSVEEAFYLLSATRFAYYFMYQWNEDFENLYGHLGGDISQQRKLVNLKMGLDSENVKIEAIRGTLSRHRDLAKLLYQDFKSRVEGDGGDDTLKERLQVPDPKDA